MPVFTDEAANSSESERIKSPTEVLEALNHPVAERIEEVRELIRRNGNMVLVGETGAGKTRCTPLALLEYARENNLEGQIIVTEPRRIVARECAHDIAGLLNTKVGGLVGYQVQHDRQASSETDLNYVTEGVLTRKIQQDPLLKSVSIVMIDEAHERSIYTDLNMGLLMRTNRLREAAGLDPIKIVVTSATIEHERFAKYLGTPDNSIEISGRMYPVTKTFLDRDPYNIDATMDAAAEQVQKSLNGGANGSILVFMPGKAEILETIDRIKKRMGESAVEILPLYGEQTLEEQAAVLKPSGAPRVIVATNIAETSLTVPDIKVVIDSGYIRQSEYDEKRGLQQVNLVPHSRSGLRQREGRAGRVSNGHYYALFSQKDPFYSDSKLSYTNRPEYTTPEIQRSELSHVVLIAKSFGIENVRDFEFLDNPDEADLVAAIKLLKILGALDADEKVTKIGEALIQIPLEPRKARMLLEAEKYKCLSEMVILSGFLEAKKLYLRPKDKEREADMAHNQFRDPESDFFTYLNIWKAYVENGYSEKWARDNFLSGAELARIRKSKDEILGIISGNELFSPVVRGKTDYDKDAVGKAVTSGLLSNLLVEEPSRRFSTYRNVFTGTGEIMIGRQSGVHARLAAVYSVSEVDVTKKDRMGGTYTEKMRFANHAHGIKTDWLLEVAPHLIETNVTPPQYSPFEDKVYADKQVFLKVPSSGGLVDLGARSTRLLDIDYIREEVTGEAASRAFALALVQGRVILPADIEDILRDNRTAISRYRDLILRAGGTI